MSTTLRDTLQIRSINRTKARVDAWWHTTHCSDAAHEFNPVFAILRAVASGHDEPEEPAPDASKH